MKGSLKLFLGLPALVLAFIAAGRMLMLNSGQELWGNWPLLLLLSLWAVVVALVQKAQNLQLLLLCTVAGLALGISFAPYGAIWAPILGFACLFQFIELATARQLRKKQVLWYGYHSMVLFNVVATWWVANTALAAGMVANFLNAFFMALVVLLIYEARKHLPKLWLGAAIALWIGFEYLHFNWQIAWPWLCVGHTFAPVPVLAQWFEVTGVFGGSLYILGSASLLWRGFGRFNKPVDGDSSLDKQMLIPNLRPYISGLLVFIIPLAVSMIWYGYAQRSLGKEAVIALIQPNYEPHYEKFSISDVDQLERFENLSAAAAQTKLTRTALGGVDLLVYPETSFNGMDEEMLEGEPLWQLWESILDSQERLGNRSGTGLLAGISSYRRFANAHDHPAMRTQSRGPGEDMHYVGYNAAVAMADGMQTAVYHKSKLVPGVEFLPYRKALFFFEPLVASLGGTTAGLGKNDSAQVFRYPNGVRAAPLICYESLYGDYVAEFVQRGANLLVVPTNDGWWDDSPGHRQHFNLARLRAIETRRWVVQAANSGTSGFIDERGRAVAKTHYGQMAQLTQSALLLEGQTFYVRFGDVIGRVLAGCAVLVILSLLSRSLIGKTQRWRGSVSEDRN